MRFLDTIKNGIFVTVLLFFLTGCNYPPSIHNQDEALIFAKEELAHFCEWNPCTPDEFDGPVEIREMSSYDPKYDWYIEFSKENNPDIGVVFVISKYKEREISSLLEDEYERRKKEEAKDRKDNPWKYN